MRDLITTMKIKKCQSQYNLRNVFLQTLLFIFFTSFTFAQTTLINEGTFLNLQNLSRQSFYPDSVIQGVFYSQLGSAHAEVINNGNPGNSIVFGNWGCQVLLSFTAPDANQTWTISFDQIMAGDYFGGPFFRVFGSLSDQSLKYEYQGGSVGTTLLTQNSGNEDAWTTKSYQVTVPAGYRNIVLAWWFDGYADVYHIDNVHVIAENDETSDVQSPSVPSGLISSNIEATSFSLSWTASTDDTEVAYYSVYQNGVLINNSFTPTLNITGLTPSTDYTMTITASDAAGNTSAQSSSIDITTIPLDETPPSAPIGLLASNVNSTGAYLTWNPSTDNSGVTGYDILLDGVLRGTAVTTSFNVLGLLPSTSYTLTVRAKDAMGNLSLLSNEVNLTTLAYTSPTDTRLFGINAAAIWDWSPEKVFANAFLSSREVCKAGHWGELGAEANIDTAKWPTEDFTFCLYAGLKKAHGTYKIIFNGNPNTVVTSSAGTISNKTVNGDKITYDLIVPESESETAQFMTFTNTNGIVRNLKIMRPLTIGSSQSYSENVMFTSEFLNFISQFGLLRSMDFMATSQPAGCPDMNWNDRNKPWWRCAIIKPYRTDTSAFLAVPWEYYIQLCNQANVDMWLCIPHLATDEYVNNLALLIKNGGSGYQGLNSNLKVYVEYSNELWNWAAYYAKQSAYIKDKGTELLKASEGNHILNYDNQPSSDWTCADGNCGWEWIPDRFNGYRTVQISTILRSVFGDAAMMTRIRPIISGQLPGGRVPVALSFIREAYGKVNAWNSIARPVNYYIYGCGGSGYYGPDNMSDNLTIDNIWTNHDFNIDNYKEYLRIEANAAITYGLKRVCYEGGPGMDPYGHSEDVKEQAWNDARITQSMIEHLDAWEEYGSEMHTFFHGVDDGPGYYAWSFTNDVTNLNNPKMYAVNYFNITNKKEITYGNVPPFSTDGNNWIKNSIWYRNDPGAGSKHLSTSTSGGYDGYWCSYLFRVTTAGKYKFSFDYANANTATVNIILDGGIPHSSKNISGSGITPVDTLNLQPGLHSVMIETIAGSLDINTVHFDTIVGVITSVTSQPMKENGLTIYPNPASNVVFLRLNSETIGNTSIYIIDIQGKTIINKEHNMVKGENQIDIDLNGLSQGLYILKVCDKNKTYQQRIVKK